LSRGEPGCSPLGVCALPDPPRNAPRTVGYPEYVHEILTHAGICYSSAAAEDLPNLLPDLRILLTVGEATLADDVGASLRTWVQGGGAWLSVAGACGAADMFGVEVEAPSCWSWGGGLGTLGEGFMDRKAASHPLLSHLSIPLHYFNGVPVRAAGGTVLAGTLDAHGRPSARAAVVEAAVGKGRCLLIAPDVTGAVVRIQQGTAVTRDGVPDCDGTAPNCDGVLKSGDGAALDWLLDRQPVPGVTGFSAFLQPIADQWRETLLRGLFYLAERHDVALPVLWLYPRNLPALAHMSHDTDGNEPSPAIRLLAVLDTAGVTSTWCVMTPGYPREAIGAIRRAGHELAMHYDAMSDGNAWSKKDFDDQWQRLTSLFDGERPITNRNHYLRWERDTEFFAWCAERGIQVDESKGASKTGEAGFNFGTCHPYLPVDPEGRIIDVLELPTPTQDLVVFAPEELVDPLLTAALRHHGVLHLLFHPAHIEKPGVADALLMAVAKAKQQGLEWWTARQISAWERARRELRWSNYTATQAAVSVRVRASDALPGASIMWLAGPHTRVGVRGRACEAVMVERWGFPFRSVTFDIEQETEYTLEVVR